MVALSFCSLLGRVLAWFRQFQIVQFLGSRAPALRVDAPLSDLKTELAAPRILRRSCLSWLHFGHDLFNF